MKYVANQPVLVPKGTRVRLTKPQAARTEHLVGKADKKGWVEVLAPFHFKAGEEFELDGELPKALAALASDRAAADKAAAAAEKLAAEKAADEAAAAAAAAEAGKTS